MHRVSTGYGTRKKTMSTKTMVKVSILSVMAFILMLMEFPIPIFPGFLKVDFSDVPALIGGFALGPVAGALIQLVKVLLFFITKTETGGIGELANFIVGAGFVVPAAMIYHLKKDRKHAILGVIVGTICMAIAGVLANLYIIIPFYTKIFPLEVIVEMGTVVNSRIVDLESLVMYGITPFNLFKGTIIGIVTIIIYKKISPLLKNN
ncbi:ECF transporter S component [Alkaliphilus hydrothermalis]|uniref:Riboflavin transporter n=1 Tax=Alkaliphilus hydrothermalis TaxID=1482730 RepID=A0ABS2NR68_9FIRM|nr:ECF transporter S component [Alkaliphilus hydrothermalis]MBM7615416.1 riboflavin transporter FmnP [Alkaliphilus hydrothermalis]